MPSGVLVVTANTKKEMCNAAKAYQEETMDPNFIFVDEKTIHIPGSDFKREFFKKRGLKVEEIDQAFSRCLQTSEV